jgi:hypothetical protein
MSALVNMLNSFNNKGFKYWTVKDVDTNKFAKGIYEFIYNFIHMSLSICWNGNVEDMYKDYMKKNKENYDRQKRGY